MIVIDATTTDPETLLREALRPDGAAYLRVGRRGRRIAERAGLVPGPELFELGELLVPLERDAVRWARRMRPRSRRAALAARFPAAFGALAAQGLIARRNGARPLAEWLRAQGVGSSVVVARHTALLVGPDGVVLAARVEPPPGARTAAERRALLTLAPQARAAGAEVPTPLSSTDLGGESLLVTTGVPGVQASELIAHRAGSRDAFVDRIAGWLERWNTSTAVDGVLSEDLLERALLAPARFLALERPHIGALEQLAAAAAGHRVKLVAAHNDLTTANVLVEGGSSLAVVDWESAEPEGLPLADLLYAVADAQAAAHSFADRPGAFVASLDRQALHEARLVERLGLHPLVADACFHACWLHHAVNERRSVEPDAGTPFLEIVRAIWARRLRLADAA